MTTDIRIPKAAIQYILYQRTELLRFARFLPLWRMQKVLPFSFKLLVSFEAALFGRAIINGYIASINEDFQNLKPYLPQICPSILDIGCGIGAINIFLFRLYKSSAPVFYLLDKNQTDPIIHYGFQPRSSFYNSLSMAKTILARNGIPEANIHLREATEDFQIDIKRKINLVVSLVSWGFHYPVESYLNAVEAVLDKDGLIIMDVRNASDGLNTLKRRFSNIQVIEKNYSYSRICAG